MKRQYEIMINDFDKTKTKIIIYFALVSYKDSDIRNN